MTGLLMIFALLTPTTQPAKAPANNLMGTQAVVHRGAPFALKEQVSLDAIAKDPKAWAGKTVQVSGKIASVCKKKGCWMVLGGTDKATTARVVFKDYGFFAPLDSMGKAAVLEGTVEAKVLDEAERKHLAEDAKAPLETIPKAELRLIATGLEVRAVGH